MIPGVTPDLRQLVKAERKRRYPSVRAAAQATGGLLSNQAWANWEAGSGDEVTSKVRQAVATAFGWETDWPENPPTPPLPDEVVSQLDEIESRQLDQAEAMSAVLDLLRGVADEVRQLRAAIESPRSSARPPS